MADNWLIAWGDRWAAEAQRFNTHHGAPGSGHGGQFVSASSGGSGGKTTAASGSHVDAGAVKQARKDRAKAQQLHAQAKTDRAKAHQLEKELHQLEHEHAQAVHQAAQHSKAARQAAHQAKAAKHHQANYSKAKHHHHQAQHHHAKAGGLVQRISHVRQQIHTLLTHAKQLDAQAAKL